MNRSILNSDWSSVTVPSAAEEVLRFCTPGGIYQVTRKTYYHVLIDLGHTASQALEMAYGRTGDAMRLGGADPASALPLSRILAKLDRFDRARLGPGAR